MGKHVIHSQFRHNLERVFRCRMGRLGCHVLDGQFIKLGKRKLCNNLAVEFLNDLVDDTRVHLDEFVLTFQFEVRVNAQTVPVVPYDAQNHMIERDIVVVLSGEGDDTVLEGLHGVPAILFNVSVINDVVGFVDDLGHASGFIGEDGEEVGEAVLARFGRDAEIMLGGCVEPPGLVGEFERVLVPSFIRDETSIEEVHGDVDGFVIVGREGVDGNLLDDALGVVNAFTGDGGLKCACATSELDGLTFGEFGGGEVGGENDASGKGFGFGDGMGLFFNFMFDFGCGKCDSGRSHGFVDTRHDNYRMRTRGYINTFFFLILKIRACGNGVKNAQLRSSYDFISGFIERVGKRYKSGCDPKKKKR